MAETYDPTPNEEPSEVDELEDVELEDEKQYIIDPENEEWLWAIPGVAILSFLLIFAIRLNFIPSPFEEFVTLAVIEGIILVILLIVGLLTVIER